MRVTPKLVSAVVMRAKSCGGRPSLEARDVLFALLGYELEKLPFPTRAQLSADLGMGERRLRAALAELRRLSLVQADVELADGRRRIDELNVRLIGAWSRGEYELEDLDEADDVAGDTGQNDRENAGQNDGYFKAETGQNDGHPRARGNSSSSSTCASSSEPLDSREAFELHTAMVSRVRKALPMLTPGARDHVWTWVGRYPLGLVEEACNITMRKGGRSIDYVETVLRSLQVATVLPDEGTRNEA